jgi:hypothetical protein
MVISGTIKMELMADSKKMLLEVDRILGFNRILRATMKKTGIENLTKLNLKSNMAVDCTKTALNSTPIEFSRKIPKSSFVDNIRITYKPGKMKSSEIVSCAVNSGNHFSSVTLQTHCYTSTVLMRTGF